MASTTEPPAANEPYHTLHHPQIDFSCPLCNRRTLVVHGYKKEGEPRKYYVMCSNEDCDGLFEGTTRLSVRDAVLGLWDALRAWGDEVMKSGGFGK